MDATTVQRRRDLDWLRVLAFLGVFFYHCGRFFDKSWWHIKNGTASPIVDVFKEIFDLWGMPLIFLISGASIFLALRPGGAARFFRDRVWRLLVPLIFGILVLGPPQIYLTRLAHGEFRGSFTAFLPLYFRDWRLWNGNFDWSGVHLWYLEDLFLFTLVLLPLFAALKSPSGRRVTESLGRLSSRPGMIFLWALPLALLFIAIDPSGLTRPALPEAFLRLAVFWPFLVYGFLVISDGGIQQAIIRQRRFSLALAVTLTVAAGLLKDALGKHPGFLPFALMTTMIGLLIWSTILAILGYGMRYLASGSRWLSYANEAVLPFYILHQPVILILGYVIIPLPLGILPKYLIIAPLAFGITLGLYEFGIRRFNPVRRFFGLKPRKPVLPVAGEATPSSVRP
jgi:glucan biosynthesis protein C